MKIRLAMLLATVSLGMLPAAEPPFATIGNGQVQIKIYLPDEKLGFYQGTRFDWSGVIRSLEFQGHDYYGPWFSATDPAIHDFIYKGSEIVAGQCSAITGPVDEFKPLGYENAQAGGSFVKIGIGALRKPDSQGYDNYRQYDVANGGEWRIEQRPDSIKFTQTLNDKPSGYGYIYMKTVELTAGRPQMQLRHSIRNTGERAIKTSVYNHNFLVLDAKPPGSGVTITVPFQIHTAKPPDARLAAIRGNKVVYLQTLTNHDVATTDLTGFGNTPQDNFIRIESEAAGAGMTIQSDRPLLSEGLWSIRTVLAMEPFISISVEPGETFTWTSTYDYYLLPTDARVH